MKYFKKGFEAVDHKWTVYGAYAESDVSSRGCFDVLVYSVDCYGGKFSCTRYNVCLKPADVTEISKEDYEYMEKTIQMADKFQAIIDFLLKELI